MNTTPRYFSPSDEPGASGGKTDDRNYGDVVKKAVEKNANHPGSEQHAAGMDNDDKGDGKTGSNTGKDLGIDRGDRAPDRDNEGS